MGKNGEYQVSDIRKRAEAAGKGERAFEEAGYDGAVRWGNVSVPPRGRRRRNFSGRWA
jgi:hypothetical protein